MANNKIFGLLEINNQRTQTVFRIVAYWPQEPTEHTILKTLGSRADRDEESPIKREVTELLTGVRVQIRDYEYQILHSFLGVPF